MKINKVDSYTPNFGRFKLKMQNMDKFSLDELKRLNKLGELADRKGKYSDITFLSPKEVVISTDRAFDLDKGRLSLSYKAPFYAKTNKNVLSVYEKNGLKTPSIFEIKTSREEAKNLAEKINKTKDLLEQSLYVSNLWDSVLLSNTQKYTEYVERKYLLDRLQKFCAKEH